MDAKAGGQVRKALGILRKCEDGEWSDEQVEAYRQQQLKQLLQHCIDTVPAYKIGGGNLLSHNLLSFDVTTKDTYRSDYDNRISSLYDKNSLSVMTTSGSSGTPFACYQNTEKRKHVNAEVLYYNGKVNYRIGKRIIYFRSIVGECAKSGLAQFAQNIYLLDCLDLSDAGIEKNLALIAKYTKHTDAMIMGYASTMDAFKRYFETHGVDKAKDCNVSGIVSGSEMLYDDTRDVLQKAFRCKCVSRYANEENGFLGQDYEVNNVFIPNRAHYYTEILKLDSDDAAEDGEVGRIVITDLYNYAMPMVRYDTGDVGAWQYVTDHGRKRKAIGSFGGRKIDMIFNAAGDAISPIAITNLMWRYQSVSQFQFAQLSANRYEIRLVVPEGKSVNTEEMMLRLQRIVGEEGIIDVKYVSSIPAMKSGKKKYVANEMR